jgi:hypothetical protein
MLVFLTWQWLVIFKKKIFDVSAAVAECREVQLMMIFDAAEPFLKVCCKLDSAVPSNTDYISTIKDNSKPTWSISAVCQA